MRPSAFIRPIALAFFATLVSAAAAKPPYPATVLGVAFREPLSTPECRFDGASPANAPCFRRLWPGGDTSGPDRPAYVTVKILVTREAANASSLRFDSFFAQLIDGRVEGLWIWTVDSGGMGQRSDPANNLAAFRQMLGEPSSIQRQAGRSGEAVTAIWSLGADAAAVFASDDEALPSSAFGLMRIQSARALAAEEAELTRVLSVLPCQRPPRQAHSVEEFNSYVRCMYVLPAYH
jgi:hypothetical protein